MAEMIDRYIWSVVYDDGTVLSEYPAGDTQHHSFAEVDISRVVQLTVTPNGWLGYSGPSYVIPCNPQDGIRPVMFRTVAVDTNTNEQRRWHVFGTQQTVGGKNVKSFLYISNEDEGGTEEQQVTLYHGEARVV